MQKNIIVHYRNVFWIFRKMRFMAMLEYRSDFWFWSFINIMWTCFNFLFFDLLLSATGNLGGWTKTEFFFLLANFTILDAFIWSVMYKNMKSYTQAIFEGSFDMLILKPISTHYLLWIKENSYTGMFRLITGIGVLTYLSVTNNIFPSSLFFLLYLLLMLSSLLLMYSIWFMIATCAFYVDRLNNINEIFPNLRRIFETPRTVYTGGIKYMFTMVVPLSLVASVPTEVYLGKPSARWILFLLVSTVVWFFISRLFFTYSIKKYSSVGS